MILKIEFLLEFNGESLIILFGLLIKVFNEICAISWRKRRNGTPM